jgi:hypothetical protein
MPLSDVVSIALAGIAAFLSGVFRSDKLPRQWNIAIALGAFLVCTGVDAWLLIGFTSDIRTDAAVFLVAGVGLAGREFASLMGYIEGAPSPLQTLVAPRVTKGNTPRPSAHEEQVL